MQTIEILLTHSNPLLRLLIKGILKLGYDNVTLYHNLMVDLGISIHGNIFEVAGWQILIQNDQFWSFDNSLGYWGCPIINQQRVIAILDKMERFDAKSY